MGALCLGGHLGAHFHSAARTLAGDKWWREGEGATQGKSGHPESNQGPSDTCKLYSQMLYQLSYSRLVCGVRDSALEASSWRLWEGATSTQNRVGHSFWSGLRALAPCPSRNPPPLCPNKAQAGELCTCSKLEKLRGRELNPGLPRDRRKY